MIERFTGETGRRILVETLQSQKLIKGNSELAEQIAKIGELIEIKSGVRIIEQGNWDNHVYLILTGSFGILVNGRQVATRGPHNTVGEMAATAPYLPRS